MRLAARRVAREMSVARGDPTSADWPRLVDRWLLMLALPPRKARKKDTIRSARRTTVKELDALCREVVFLRDGAKCRKCGSESHLQWAHIYSRRYRSVRHDPLNSLVLCAGDHLWQHHNPLDAMNWLASELGEENYAALRNRRNQYGTPNPIGIQAALEKEKATLLGRTESASARAAKGGRS